MHNYVILPRTTVRPVISVYFINKLDYIESAITSELVEKA